MGYDLGLSKSKGTLLFLSKIISKLELDVMEQIQQFIITFLLQKVIFLGFLNGPTKVFLHALRTVDCAINLCVQTSEFSEACILYV